MSMSTERAIEILDPEHREHYDGLEEINEACRMGMAALRALKGIQWIPVSERLPDIDDGLVMVVCSAKLGGWARLRDDIQLAEYFEEDDVWELEGWPDAQNLTVSHWMRLPMLPEGLP